MESFLIIDFAAILTLLLSGLACSLIGNFLVLRKEAMLADAISHSVLPGIVLSFFFFNQRQGGYIFIGALISAIVASFSIKALRRYGKLDEMTSTGVIFSTFFALGIVLLEKLSTSNIDLDVDCVLHGQLESILWVVPPDVSFISANAISYLPVELIHSAFSFVLALLFIWLIRKELTLISFDKNFAQVLGLPVFKYELLFSTVVAFVIVSSFKVIGSILVICLIVTPAACSRMFADSINGQILISTLFTLIILLTSYVFASLVPEIYGFEHSLSTAGVVSLFSGVAFFISILLSPRYGLIGRKFRLERQKVMSLTEDILGLIYRNSEKNLETNYNTLQSLYSSRKYFKIINYFLKRIGILNLSNGNYKLSPIGLEKAKSIVRRHRLWESYLVQEVGIKDDHVHESAEEMEHILSQDHENYLIKKVQDPLKDPHGKEIP